MIYGFVFAWVGSLATCSSLAEMASMSVEPDLDRTSLVFFPTLLAASADAHFRLLRKGIRRREASITGSPSWRLQSGPSS